MATSEDLHKPLPGRGSSRSTLPRGGSTLVPGSTLLARMRHGKGPTILIVSLTLVALLSAGLASTSSHLPGIPLASAASCTSSGVLPNRGGTTTVNVNSTWCASSRSTWLHAGGLVSVGSSSAYVSLTIKNVSVQVDGNFTVGSLADAFKAVNLIIDNATIAFIHPDTGITIDYVGSSSVVGDTVIVKSGAVPLSASTPTPGRCIACTVIQGNVSDFGTYPFGIHVLSGTGANRQSKVVVYGTRFVNLGNYWNYSRAALDLAIIDGSSYSVLAPGSKFEYLNFTGPFGQNATWAFGTIGNPVETAMGDAAPIQRSFFYGGYMGVNQGRFVWDNWFYGLCQYGYSYSSLAKPAVWQNNSFWYGNGTQHQGGGCKNINFFYPYTRARNNFIGSFLGGNVLDGAANNTIVNGLLAGTPGDTHNGNSGVGCADNGAGGWAVFTNVTLWGGAQSGDAIQNMYCNNHLNMSNDKYDSLWPAAQRGGLYIGLNPGFPQVVQGGSTLTRLIVNNASDFGNIKPGFSLSWTSPNVLSYITVNGTGYSHSRCIRIGPYANATTATYVTCRSYGYGVRIENTTGVTFIATMFTNMASPNVDWFLSGADGVTLVDQNIAVESQTMQSVQTTSVSWKWNNLKVDHDYRLYRNGTTPTAIAFSSDGSGMGTVALTNPNDDIYAYTLLDLGPSQGASPSPVNLIVSPRTVTVSASGSVHFSSVVSYSDGSESPASPTWSAENGTIQSDGTFLPWSSGNWTVCASFGNLTDCADVSVVPGLMVRLIPRPANVDATVGQSVVLGAQAFDAKGNPLASVSLTWGVTPSALGSIEQGTVFVARAVGSGSLHVSATSNGVTLTSSISVTVSSSSVFPGGLSLDNPLFTALLLAGIGGALIAVFFAIRRKARRDVPSGTTELPGEAFVYRCGSCDAEVSEVDTVCPNCGVRFRG